MSNKKQVKKPQVNKLTGIKKGSREPSKIPRKPFEKVEVDHSNCLGSSTPEVSDRYIDTDNSQDYAYAKGYEDASLALSQVINTPLNEFRKLAITREHLKNELMIFCAKVNYLNSEIKKNAILLNAKRMEINSELD